MRADPMKWVQRLVGLVFLTGVVGLGAAVTALVRQAEGVPPLPIYLGLLGMVVLILLAGSCLALISLALTASRSAELLQRIVNQGPASTTIRPFSATPLRDVAQPSSEEDSVPPARPARPAGRKLVAER
ncbi:hypothetical protein PAF17_03830 [Paracoccus sp. Z330]|uniref:Uncharacterized protein n=1 Tax=Paracoccus onchidii TaxID=3017813 RepID=A0ABT4ZB89_9RHOB|nr:hypothetical protein [Paracoccus onchidii]MDB6176632.1 hypothetical protein [Paracoccus onchidii]